jgi:hypothetical protein
MIIVVLIKLKKEMKTIRFIHYLRKLHYHLPSRFDKTRFENKQFVFGGFLEVVFYKPNMNYDEVYILLLYPMKKSSCVN